jgi:hypothetical protein
MIRALAISVALACAMASLVGCSRQGNTVDMTPLPTIANPPFICDHIPLKAVELATGVQAPLTQGSFDLSAADGYGDGWCGAYQTSGDRKKVLEVVLVASGTPGHVEEEVNQGAKRLPAIISGAEGFYSKKENEQASAVAVLIRDKAMLVVDVRQGADGRDHEADAVALMKLIAPKLITDKSAPTPSPKDTKGT